jgi:hypothetical protein
MRKPYRNKFYGRAFVEGAKAPAILSQKYFIKLDFFPEPSPLIGVSRHGTEG